MRISKKKLSRASTIIIIYILLTLTYGVVIVLGDGKGILNMLLLTAITINIAFIYHFFHKFLKRYQNFRDRYHIIRWIIILLVLHNFFCIIKVERPGQTSDILFIIQLIFIFISGLLFAFYIALFNKLSNMSLKHFQLLHPLSLTYLLVPIILIMSVIFLTFQGANIITAISNDYPSFALTFIQILPFAILLRIYEQAKYVRDN